MDPQPQPPQEYQSAYRGQGAPQGIDAGQLIQELLSNEHIPPIVQQQLWALFGRTVKLTQLEESDVRRLMKVFELVRLTALESMPKSEYNEDVEMLWHLIRLEFEMNLKRAKGRRLTERELLGMSTSATFAERPISSAYSDNPGFVSRLTRGISSLLGGGQKQ